MAGRRRSARTMLPRAPRGMAPRARRENAARRPHSHHQRRAVKRATIRDCCRRCVYCAARLELHLATVDHVYPRARGGAHVPGNLVAACGRCNRLKGDMLPQDFFARHPWAGANFILYARAAHRALKRSARRAVSLAYATEAAA